MKVYEYSKILNSLETFHEQKVSLRTLHQHLRGLKLGRRCQFTCTEDKDKLIEAIFQELNGLEYRLMSDKLRTCYSITTTRNCIMKALQELNPVGVLLRQSHRWFKRSYISDGSNDYLHIDGYDKIKQFGIPIHGCSDGCSRRITICYCSTFFKVH